MMVSYECSVCDGTGKEQVVEARNGRVRSYQANCSHCFGAGSLRNGKPELDIDVGVVETGWEDKWSNYAEERMNGIEHISNLRRLK